MPMRSITLGSKENFQVFKRNNELQQHQDQQVDHGGPAGRASEARCSDVELDGL